MSVLPENWHTRNLQDADFCSDFYFVSEFPTLNRFLGKFWSQNSKLSVFPENLHTWYLEDADSYSNIGFLNFQPYIHFWANLGWKIQSCPFCLKLGTQSILKMLILIPTSVFWNFKCKSKACLLFFDISFLKFQT